MTVRIITDSTSDIALDLAEQLGITIVPIYINFGDKTYRDQVDMDADEFYRRLETGPVHPVTSAPSPGDFIRVFKKLAQEANEILSIHLSSKTSGTYNAALLAKEALSSESCRIEVVDSQFLTMGLGLIVIMAAKAASIGVTLQQLVGRVGEAILQTYGMGLFGTLKYLAKGGRIGKAASLLGSVLNVKPLITMRDGELHPVGLARTHGKGIDRLCEFVRSALPVRDLAIMHSTTPHDAQILAERISFFLPQIRPWMARLGPGLGTHCGPGTLVVALRKNIESASAAS